MYPAVRSVASWGEALTNWVRVRRMGETTKGPPRPEREEAGRRGGDGQCGHQHLRAPQRQQGVGRRARPVELREWQTQLQRGRAVIHLLCTQETRDHATAFVRLCWRAGSPGDEHYDQTIAALPSYTDSLRKELGSD